MDAYIGNEPLIINGSEAALTMNDYWRWAYSDFTSNVNRSAFAEFLVASSLELIGMIRTEQKPYDLLTKEGCRIKIKAAGYVQSHDTEHPDYISFRIAPDRLPGEYASETPFAHSCDVYIFCIYKALSKDESPLDLDLWDFYVLPAKVLDEKKPTQKTITLQSLMKLEPLWCNYYGIGEAIQKLMTV